MRKVTGHQTLQYHAGPSPETRDTDGRGLVVRSDVLKSGQDHPPAKMTQAGTGAAVGSPQKPPSQTAVVADYDAEEDSAAGDDSEGRSERPDEKMNPSYAEFMTRRITRAPIVEAGRVGYLGESSNLSLLIQDRHGTTDNVHYPLPRNANRSGVRMTDLDQTEIEILHQRGAFLLPHRALCDDMVKAYFEWVAPVVPIINRSRFMRRYRDPQNPPSLLLLQAVLLAGSRVCNNPRLMDINGSSTPAAITFYKRAKALYDANFEDDRLTIIQALILMGWYWEGPEGNGACRRSQLREEGRRLSESTNRKTSFVVG